MSSTESNIPKAALYYSPKSVWSAVETCFVILTVGRCRYEKGYGIDELDFHIVDLASGENYNPTFLRLNPKATVPTLVVPLQKTLSEDVESRYKAITDSTVCAGNMGGSCLLRCLQAIAEFLDKSRSAQSRTHTTSDAPAPTLTPATIAFLEKSKEVIDLLHSSTADPNKLWYFNARDAESLKSHAAEVLPVLTGGANALTHFLGEAESEKIHVSEKTKQFWVDKKASVQALLDVFSVAEKADNELSGDERTKREAYFAAVRSGWADAKTVLQKLDKAVIGPYVLGDQFSIADLHLSAWLGRVARLAHGGADDDGKTIVQKIGERIGEKTAEEERTKIGMYWERVRERPSWKKVYSGGLF
ncbi:hypothetical protein AN958_05056 [Leucoagaricus sp. SymC.cos]|nr:hypothetical protein AN958_05056 [Leucoagaricus sp. SymC.cos]